MNGKEDHDMLISVYTSVNLLREEVTESNSLIRGDIHKIRNSLEKKDDECKSQILTCTQRVERNGNEFARRPTWTTLLIIIGGLFSLILGSYAYTYLIKVALTV